MTLLTSITIIICVLIISITNIISGYFKPEVILNRKNNKLINQLINCKYELKEVIKKLESGIYNQEDVILDDILEDLQKINRILNI